ncbi:MAG: hypothetical protein NTU49_02420, partial [Gammaproteobacteria bacterium]|nr:hypothetical protein [Gammaproteobacteria bacterium]
MRNDILQFWRVHLNALNASQSRSLAERYLAVELPPELTPKERSQRITDAYQQQLNNLAKFAHPSATDVCAIIRDLYDVAKRIALTPFPQDFFQVGCGLVNDHEISLRFPYVNSQSECSYIDDLGVRLFASEVWVKRLSSVSNQNDIRNLIVYSSFPECLANTKGNRTIFFHDFITNLSATRFFLKPVSAYFLRSLRLIVPQIYKGNIEYETMVQLRFYARTTNPEWTHRNAQEQLLFMSTFYELYRPEKMRIAPIIAALFEKFPTLDLLRRFDKEVMSLSAIFSTAESIKLIRDRCKDLVRSSEEDLNRRQMASAIYLEFLQNSLAEIIQQDLARLSELL